MEFKDVKLIIWDLDETLWKGTLSDGEVVLPDNHKRLLFDLTDRGIVNSICSKNDDSAVNEELRKNKILDLFVFNSINWSPKGQRVKQIVEEMGLRFPNVMFIDDNPLNRAEVQECCKGITAESEKIINHLIDCCEQVNPTDLQHARLNQYKVLEKKREFKAKYGSNEDFLKISHITVDINYDCKSHIDRIHDLILRSNQLNFTKVRSTMEELKKTIENDNILSGYVHVKDDFGDYGIIGFFALDKMTNCLIHFVFSCRTLGMGVEQYIYKKIGRPELTVVGEVSSDVNTPDPKWISEERDTISHTIDKISIDDLRIVIKGPCDMQILFGYIAENKNITTEFVYVNDKGVSIEGFNHTAQIVGGLHLSEEKKKEFGKLYSFCDSKMFTTQIFSPDTNVVVLSMFTDPHLGIYRHRDSGVLLAFGEYTNDLTDESKWDKYINKELFVANCNFTKTELQKIEKELEFLGRLSPQQIVDNVGIIYNYIPSNSLMVLVLGSETPFITNKKEAYQNREVFHKNLNGLLKTWAKDKDRVRFLDVNKYITGQESFTDNINHFQRSVYFKMSHDLVDIIDQYTGAKLRTNGEMVASLAGFYQKVKKAPNKIKGLLRKK